MQAVPPIPITNNEAQRAMQANKDHQYALKVYTERLEAELQTVDRLLALVDYEDESDLDTGGSVVIPGAKKAIGLIPSPELLSNDSPFYDDAQKRLRFLHLTSVHPMKAKELEVLAEAVRTENFRREALNVQARGQGLLNLQPSSVNMEINKEGLDWVHIAEKVSEVSFTTRSPKECEIRWLGDRHPNINHSPWLASEVSNLKAIVSELPSGQVDWVAVSKKLGTNRSPIDCMRHGVQRLIHVWTPESDNRLMECVRIYGLENWNLVARHVSEDATATGCQSRYHRTIDPSVKHGNWTPEEDERLRRAMTVYGNSWAEIATMIPGRTNDQCRDRWSDRLNPTLVKGKWSPEEDALLLQAVQSLGGKWREVSEQLGGGRTDNMCRSRYDVLMKHKAQVDVAENPGSHGDQRTKRGRAAGRRPKANAKGKEKGKDVVAAADAISMIPSDDIQAVVRPRPRPKPRKKTDLVFDDEYALANGDDHLEVASDDAVQEIHHVSRSIDIVLQDQSAAHDSETRTQNVVVDSTDDISETLSPDSMQMAIGEHQDLKVGHRSTTTKRKRVSSQLPNDGESGFVDHGLTHDTTLGGTESNPTETNARRTVITEGSPMQNDSHRSKRPTVVSANVRHIRQPIRSSPRLRQKQGPAKDVNN